MKQSIVPFGLALLLLLSGTALAQSPQEILDQFAAEPTILEVQEAAAAYAHIDDDQIGRWTTRADLSALLPRLRVQYWMDYQDDEQKDDAQVFSATADGLLLTRVDRDVRIEDDNEIRVRLQGDWDLRDLVFNPDLLRISRERSNLVELREEILTTVTSLYFERRRSQIQSILDPPSNAMERLRRELEIQQLTAGIDALTGGWFSQQLSQAGVPTY
ncbi:MAG: hypothetical protein JW797_18225 [Bradymonadales bacterium]|nr:hypothetical protein [Bradymonadales bacterium]